MNWKTISRSFTLINFKASATATFKLAYIKDYMAMKSTWNRTCFPNPPGCCMYRLPFERVGPDIRGSRWVAFLLSVSWNWHLHTASGQRVFILFISHSRGDRYRQCLCLEQSKIRQTSSGRVVIMVMSIMRIAYLFIKILRKKNIRIALNIFPWCFSTCLYTGRLQICFILALLILYIYCPV